MKTKILSLALLCMAMSACESMDITNDSQGNTESWYSTETELEMAANEFYILGYWQEPLNSTDQWSDDFTYRNINRNPNSDGQLLNGTLNGLQYEVYALWQQSYKLVARANTMINHIDKAYEAGIDTDVVNRYLGEAYFSRACKYGDLVFFYGDVPYMNGTETITEAESRGRTDKDEVIEKMYEDFDLAIEYLPAEYTSGEIRFTKGAALAMKARYALWFGDYDICVDACEQCMDLGVYALYDDFEELFLQSTKLVDEKIFCIPRSAENDVVLDVWFVNNGLPRNAGGYGSDNPSWDLLAAFLCTDGLPIDESPLFDPLNPFENRDPRCTMTIVEFNTRHVSFEYDPIADEVMNYSTGSMQTNQDNRAINQYASYNGLLWKKGIDDSWTENGKNVEVDYTTLRYADVLLMYAEANIELNNLTDEVVDCINQVRARAYGVSSSDTDDYPAVTMGTQDELRKAVRIERRMEFAKENLRLMDLMRWKLAYKALNSYNYIMLSPDDRQTDVIDKGLWFWGKTPSVDEDGLADFSELFDAGLCQTGALRVFPERQYLWPIPTHDMEICPNLVNNDGY